MGELSFIQGDRGGRGGEIDVENRLRPLRSMPCEMACQGLGLIG